MEYFSVPSDSLTQNSRVGGSNSRLAYHHDRARVGCVYQQVESPTGILGFTFLDLKLQSTPNFRGGVHLERPMYIIPRIPEILSY